ncbi:MAG: hypothetical protein WBC60_09240 [Cognaticolwellia sp.]|jgi:hypothetical protein
MDIDRQHMKNFKEVKTEIEEIERDKRLHRPKACDFSEQTIVIEQAILVSQLEALYWVLGENMPDYECQKVKSSPLQSVKFRNS